MSSRSTEHKGKNLSHTHIYIYIYILVVWVYKIFMEHARCCFSRGQTYCARAAALIITPGWRAGCAGHKNGTPNVLYDALPEPSVSGCPHSRHHHPIHHRQDVVRFSPVPISCASVPRARLGLISLPSLTLLHLACRDVISVTHPYPLQKGSVCVCMCLCVIGLLYDSNIPCFREK